jgi:hypothetical protein
MVYEAEIVIRRRDRAQLFADMQAVTEFLERRECVRQPTAENAVSYAERIVAERQ